MKENGIGGEPRSEGEWREILEKRRESGLGIGEYCTGLGIRQGAYYRWRRKLEGLAAPAVSKKSKRAEFADVTQMVQPQASPDWAVELKLSSGVTIRVRG